MSRNASPKSKKQFQFLIGYFFGVHGAIKKFLMPFLKLNIYKKIWPIKPTSHKEDTLACYGHTPKELE